MSHNPTTTIRIDPKVKALATETFDEIGISLSAAVNAFLKAVVREGGIPFEMKIPKPDKPEAEPKNLKLNKAFLAKRDEFYTFYEDIDKEVARYEGKFEGKTVLCNCDDPFESAFFRYFTLNFEKLGLVKLMSTCYSDSPIAGKQYPLEGSRTAYRTVITEMPEGSLVRPDGSLDLEPVFQMGGNSLNKLTGNGDFRSDECKELLKEADIVVTNPPFSLFREYIALLMEYNKTFLILGNMNAVTNKQVFPLFRDDRVWYGETIRSGDRKFHVPDDYPFNAAGYGTDADGRRFIKVKGVRWYTNLDNGKRHEPLALSKEFRPEDYPRYENYNAIEVNRTSSIPRDYDGIMGVPITFLDKYSPDQWEILMLANGNARTNVDAKVLDKVGYQRHPDDKGGVGIVEGRRVYARVLIRKKTK